MPNDLNQNNIQIYPQGVIFDLDGTLVDNEELHKFLFQEMSRTLGYRLMDDEYASNLSGLGDVEVIEYILRAARRTRSAVELAEQKRNRYLKYVKDGHIKATLGAVDYVRSLADKNVKMAIATNASQDEAELTLSQLGLTDAITTIISIDQVTRGKPSPDIPLRAARRLKLTPSQCLVYEDSLHGVQAAVSAGMCVIGVSRTDQWRLMEAGTATVIENFFQHELPVISDLKADEEMLQ